MSDETTSATIRRPEMFKQLKAFLTGIITFRKPYKTSWDSFDELAAYDLGREGTRRVWKWKS